MELASNVLELKEVIVLLRFEVNRAGGQTAWAKKAGVHRTIVNRVLKGQKSLNKKMGLQGIEWVILGDHSGGKACGQGLSWL